VFNLLGVHLHPYELSMGRWIDLSRRGEAVQRAQSDQSAALLERMGRLDDPTLVAGDFNSTRDAALHVGLRQTLTDTWERGGLGFGGTVRLLGWAPLRVDYSYASGEFAVIKSRVVEAGCSDHRPVVSDLVLRP
jgi:endonuclease/exonuclease/phosphatase (EEP) superfamily protein YafD